MTLTVVMLVKQNSQLDFFFLFEDILNFMWADIDTDIWTR
jgi:hypothetical protein